MSVVEQQEKQQQPQQSAYTTMPCGFEEDFVDFESAAHQYSISSCASDEWAISELDDEALGIVDDRTSDRGCNSEDCNGGVSKSATSTTGSQSCDCDSNKKTTTSQSSTVTVGEGMKSVDTVIGNNCNAGSTSNTTDDDLLFGTTSSRSYGTSFYGSGKSRPTMISAKYRLKEERRKVLKISINKLKKIEDPESSLRRSVLINNTMKRLQKEAREEKLQKQLLHTYTPRCYTPSTPSSQFAIKDADADSVCSTKASREEIPSIVSRSIENIASPLSLDNNKDDTFPSSPPVSSSFENTSIKSNGTCEDLINSTASNQRVLTTDCLCDETIDDIVVDSETKTNLTLPVVAGTEINRPPSVVGSNTSECASAFTSRKRSFDEVEDCDVHDVLSQFYMPPTPRMLTSIDDTDDEDEDVNVVDIDIVSSDLELSASTLQPSIVENVNSLNPSSTSSSIICSSVTVSNRCKRPRFSEDSDVDIDVDPVEELELTRTDKVPSNIPVSCDRLRTSSSANNLDDQEDIEVVLEDNEDIQRRLLLCSAAASTRTTASPPCWTSSSDASVRTSEQSCASPVVSSIQTTDNLVGLGDGNSHSHLRISSNLSVESKPMLSSGGSFCGSNNTGVVSNNNNNNSSVILDTSEHQYSCGHSSIFGELQSVVFHSLIASLES